MKRNKLLALVIGICLITTLLIVPFLSACGTRTETPAETPGETSGTTPTPSTAVKTVKIGFLCAFSGSYAVSGQPIRDGAMNAADMINGAGGFTVNGQQYKLEVIPYDTRTDPKRAVAGALYLHELIDAKMQCGPYNSLCLLPVQPLYETWKVLNVSATASLVAVRPGIEYTWGVTSNGNMRMSALAAGIVGMEAKTVGLMSENTEYAQDSRRAMLAELNKKGIKITSDEITDSSVTDFSTVIARVRAQNPDVLCPIYSGGPAILLAKQVYESGWRVQIAGSPEFAGDELYRVIGPGGEGIVSVAASFTYYQLTGGTLKQAALDGMGTNIAKIQQIADTFVKKYEPKGLSSSFFGYESIASFVEVMQKAGTVDDSVKLRQAYMNMEFDGAVAKIKALPTHYWTVFLPVSRYHESTVGADKYDMLFYVTHTDDLQQNWVTTEITKVDKIPEIRKMRGY
ncbi:MAG: ABC transporter substrate-binding protein [Dehalococcoidales bacterium]|nr:ABC transporter substrate-binding protein [Dehalococcoidales bacterium]